MFPGCAGGGKGEQVNGYGPVIIRKQDLRVGIVAGAVSIGGRTVPVNAAAGGAVAVPLIVGAGMVEDVNGGYDDPPPTFFGFDLLRKNALPIAETSSRSAS